MMLSFNSKNFCNMQKLSPFRVEICTTNQQVVAINNAFLYYLTLVFYQTCKNVHNYGNLIRHPFPNDELTYPKDGFIDSPFICS